MRTRGSDRTSGEAGFTLVEALLALALLAAGGITCVGLLGQLTRSSVDAWDEVDRHATAVAVMESLLTRGYEDLAVATTSGTAPNGASWTVSVTDENSGLRRLTVEVDHRGRHHTLETLVSDR